MQRHAIDPRDDWQQVVSSQGLIYHSPDGQPYWDESAYYSFTSQEIDALESATNSLQEMCLAAVQHVIDKNRFREFHIPDFAVAMIKNAWEAEPPAIYGRLDLAFDGENIKLLEYNADTPTALLESAVVQWYWLQDRFPKADQFNSIHERLIAKWKELDAYVEKPLYFAHLDNAEDSMTAIYMRDMAQQAGIATGGILVPDIGWNGIEFTDLKEKPIRSCFKLYPWEWMLDEENGKHLPATENQVQWIEPIWKMVLSNKAILPVLWELFPNHKYLLKSYFNSAREMSTYARKPLLSREGANISLTTENGEVRTEGGYGAEGYIYQELAPIPNYNSNFPVIGSWLIDGESAGIGIRESEKMITTNKSRFVPHLFWPAGS
jgi:glutathionylspermidine synthase